MSLTDADREALSDWWDSDWPDTSGGALASLASTVEDIVERHLCDAASRT